MAVIEIAVTEHKLAARLVAIRTWLYKKKCDPIRLETEPEESDIVLVRVEFQADHLAEAFRRTFDPRAASFAVSPNGSSEGFATVDGSSRTSVGPR